MTRLRIAVFSLCLAACTSSSTTDGGVDASVDLATLDAAESDASVACGSLTCHGPDICVRPCCGGAVPPCEPPLDGGACAPGSSYRSCYGPGMTTGCVHVCVPPASFCAPPPPPDTCNGGLSCPTCPTGGGGHYDAERREINCLCA